MARTDMAIKHFCDTCPKEIVLPDKDKFVLSIQDKQEKNVMIPKELCVFCKEKVVAYLQTLKNEEVKNG
jgi:hypothetical protein